MRAGDVRAVEADASTVDEEAQACTGTPAPATTAPASGHHRAQCICRYTPGSHWLCKRQREGSVYVSRRTVPSLTDLVCSVFQFDALSLWCRELSVWASRCEEAC